MTHTKDNFLTDTILLQTLLAMQRLNVITDTSNYACNCY